jgi:hypothetical protein
LTPCLLSDSRRDILHIVGTAFLAISNDQAAVMRYILAAAMTMAMLMGPAYSQMTMENSAKDPLALKYEREERARKDNENEYNAQMKRLKAQAPAATKNDPWSGVRPTNDASTKR